MDSPTRNNIVILGGGFGGLKTALTLAKAFGRDKNLARENEIIVVDEKDYHLFTPALYEVATTLREDASAFALKCAAALPFETLFRRKPVTFIQGRITRLDGEKRSVLFKDGTALKWDVLVAALGAEPNFFDLPGVGLHGLAFKKLEDAIEVRNRVRERFDLKRREKKTLRIVIGGGGLTGVELAGELNACLATLSRKNRSAATEIKAPPYAITIVEAGPTVLPGFNTALVGWAEKRLKKLGVALLTGRKISRVTGLKVVLEPKGNEASELLYDVFIWAGGVQAPALFRENQFLLPQDDKGRLMADDYLELRAEKKTAGGGRIFVLGDNCCVTAPGRDVPLPGTAAFAEQQGAYAARRIVAFLTGQPAPEPYQPRELGFVIPIGGKWAMAQIGGWRFKGFPAWVLKQLVMLRYLLEVLPFGRALALWFRAVRLFMRND